MVYSKRQGASGLWASLFSGSGRSEVQRNGLWILGVLASRLYLPSVRNYIWNRSGSGLGSLLALSPWANHWIS